MILFTDINPCNSCRPYCDKRHTVLCEHMRDFYKKARGERGKQQPTDSERPVICPEGHSGGKPRVSIQVKLRHLAAAGGDLQTSVEVYKTDLLKAAARIDELEIYEQRQKNWEFYMKARMENEDEDK